MNENKVNIYPTTVTPIDELLLWNAADKHIHMATMFAGMNLDMISDQEVAKAFTYGALAHQIARCLELSEFIGAETAMADFTAPEVMRFYAATNKYAGEQ